MKLFGYDLQRTCYACPEQYDVFEDGKQVAYLRLRHGYFYAEVPDCGGTTVYTCYTKGDGIFNENERIPVLTNAILAVDSHLKQQRYEKESKTDSSK